jgi:hypothetical protein
MLSRRPSTPWKPSWRQMLFSSPAHGRRAVRGKRRAVDQLRAAGDGDDETSELAEDGDAVLHQRIAQRMQRDFIRQACGVRERHGLVLERENAREIRTFLPLHAAHLHAGLVVVGFRTPRRSRCSSAMLRRCSGSPLSQAGSTQKCDGGQREHTARCASLPNAAPSALCSPLNRHDFALRTGPALPDVGAGKQQLAGWFTCLCHGRGFTAPDGLAALRDEDEFALQRAERSDALDAADGTGELNPLRELRDDLADEHAEHLRHLRHAGEALVVLRAHGAIAARRGRSAAAARAPSAHRPAAR